MRENRLRVSIYTRPMYLVLFRDLRLPKTCAAIIQYPQSLHRICHTASRAGSGDAYLLLELVSLNAKLLGLLAKSTGSSSLCTVACRCRGKPPKVTENPEPMVKAFCAAEKIVEYTLLFGQMEWLLTRSTAIRVIHWKQTTAQLPECRRRKQCRKRPCSLLRICHQRFLLLVITLIVNLRTLARERHFQASRLPTTGQGQGSFDKSTSIWMMICQPS